MKIQKLNQSINKRNSKMLKYATALLLLLLFATGCNQESNILGPADTVTNNEVIVSEPNWITLPAKQDMVLKKDVSVSKMIYGNDESLLEINTGYAGGPYGWVSITANARFQRYSFTGQRYTTMSVNDQFGTATFSPSGTFSKPVIYNLTIIGVDLSNVDPAKIKFVYMASDGKYYQAACDRISIDKQAGKIELVNAHLPHFSRYGFVN